MPCSSLSNALASGVQGESETPEQLVSAEVQNVLEALSRCGKTTTAEEVEFRIASGWRKTKGKKTPKTRNSHHQFRTPWGLLMWAVEDFATPLVCMEELWISSALCLKTSNEESSMLKGTLWNSKFTSPCANRYRTLASASGSGTAITFP